MAVEYKLRGDASQLKKEFQSVTAKEKRLEQQTIRTKQGFDRLNISALKNENALRKAKLQATKLTAAELKLAVGTKVATAGMRNQRRVTSGLAATIGAFRNQVLLVTFALSGFVLAAKKVIDLASDLNEAQNLVNQTFGDSAEEINDFSEKAAGAIGQTRGEALALLGSLGSVVKGFGFTEEAASNFSQTALQLASDIGSLKNATTTEVLNAFRSAITGQSEPMLRFGTDTRIATLEQLALGEGIVDVKRKLTTQETAVAALIQVYETNKDAIDDFKNTQNEFATASKITTAKVKELVEELGTKMLPAAAQAAVGLTILVDNLDLVKKAVNEAFTFPIITERFGVDLVEKTKKMFQDMQNSLKENAENARNDKSFFAPLLSFMAKMVGVDIETEGVIKEKTKTSLDELLDLFKDAQTKFESAFDIERGVKDAVTLLTDQTREYVELLPPASISLDELLDTTIKIRDTQKLINKSAGELPNRYTLSGRALEQNIENQRAIFNLTKAWAQQLGQALLHARDLKSIMKSTASLLINFAIAKAFGPFQPSFFAHGTNFAPGGPAVVGERGPELVNLPRGSQVIPNQTTNNTNNVSFNMPNVKTFDRFTVENQLMPLIREQLAEGDFF